MDAILPGSRLWWFFRLHWDQAVRRIPLTRLPGTYGNIGRAVLVQPTIWDLDISLVRAIRVRERHNLEFRAEAFNILNHPNCTCGFHTAMNDPLFGTINYASDPRILQLSLKYKF